MQFGMHSGPVLGVLAVALALGSSCDSCGGGGGGGGGGSWLVGRDGLMLNVATTPGQARPYGLRTRRDLTDIVCRGEFEAWVVGQAGTLLTTSDGGATWIEAALGTTETLRGVAVAEQGTAYAVGDAGIFFRSVDHGHHWQALPAGPVAWTAVATRDDGGAALLTAIDGSLWRFDGTTAAATRVYAGDGTSLNAVALDGPGMVAIAVGDNGLMIESRDGGLTWNRLPLGTTRSLRDLWLLQGAGRVVAVGEAGVIVDWRMGAPAAGARIDELLPAALSLRGIHLETGGHGMIVGDAGWAFMTHDAGLTWTRLDLRETRDILAVDALEVGPHL